MMMSFGKEDLVWTWLSNRWHQHFRSKAEVKLDRNSSMYYFRSHLLTICELIKEENVKIPVSDFLQHAL